MELSKSKQNKSNKIKRQERRLRSINKNPEQSDVFYKNLINRVQRKEEIKNQIINIISSEENLAIEDIKNKIGIDRNTLNYWINVFEKEGWFKRETIKTEGVDKTGRPKTLILNKRKLKEKGILSYKRFNSFGEADLDGIVVKKILSEIEEKKSLSKQRKNLIELFDKFEKKGIAEKFAFLMYEDFVKLNYRFKLTDKCLEYLKKHKPKKKSSS